jgi:hypothetical protein
MTRSEPDETTAIQKLADLTVEHRRLRDYEVSRRPEGLAVGDWHCKCGWFGNHGWEGYAGHLQEVIRLAAAAPR